ncbi:hypothetical protein BDA99DRAFT_215816 [Phascolomyces articulosus]|uniref:Secreted protein n=1 Tax=Phascolomyces articulosus TaxID=60185 RepID=A0AAD5JQG4_9FUNG|nr:hypothetical protein BDA99DRAFT_215816 [Phascolomyces articulosus]
MMTLIFLYLFLSMQAAPKVIHAVLTVLAPTILQISTMRNLISEQLLLFVFAHAVVKKVIYVILIDLAPLSSPSQ